MLFFLLVSVSFGAETPISADAFVDSVGVNIHLSNATSFYYQQFPAVVQALEDLHVRHVRDGIVDYGPGSSFYYDNHNALSRAGIRCNYIVGLGIPDNVVAAYPARVQDIESLEAVNEIDDGRDPSWIPDIQAQVRWLLPLANSLDLPLIGPSFVNLQWWSSNSFALVGNLSQYMNFNNLHNYLAGFNPETSGWGGCDSKGKCYGSIPWNLDQAAIDGPKTPVWTTETGYDVNSGHSNSVPPAVYGTYLPRLLLDQWNAGIKRTFIYELVDDAVTSPYLGLMDNKGNRGPAFSALSSLLGVIQDPGPPFTPTVPFTYSISGDTSNVRHTLLEKRDGTVMVAFWNASPIYDPNAKTPLAVPPQTVTVTFPSTVKAAQLYTYDPNWLLQPRSVPIMADQVSLEVTSNVTVLELSSPPEKPCMPFANKWVEIVSKNSGKCLNADASLQRSAPSLGPIKQSSCTGQNNQAFQFNPISGGYQVTVKNSGLQISVNGGPSVTRDGAELIPSLYWGGGNQIWKLNPSSDGYYTLSEFLSGKCLDITGASKFDGAIAQQWTCWGGSNQQWKMVPLP